MERRYGEGNSPGGIRIKKEQNTSLVKDRMKLKRTQGQTIYKLSGGM